MLAKNKLVLWHSLDQKKIKKFRNKNSLTNYLVYGNMFDDKTTSTDKTMY